ncbi:hypothetical protein [Hydrogenivirga sp.]
MEEKELTGLLEALLEGRIEKKELNRLGIYLLNFLRSVSRHLSEELRRRSESETIPESLFYKFAYSEEGRKDLLHEFLTHLISKKHLLLEKLRAGSGIKAYLWQMAKNFMIDLWKKNLKKELSAESIDNDEEGKKPLEIEDSSYMESLELIEIEGLVLSVVKEDEIKYLCYFLKSDRYMCLWGNKSKDAIYKDVSRKKDALLQRLGEVLSGNGVSEEAFSEFVKVRLSGICEELRSKYCKEREK